MRAAWLAAPLIPFAAGPLAAKDITLTPPIDCQPGSGCFIQQYVDHDPTDGASDYRCENLTYDAHKGTDFALASLAAMRAGVDVHASAPGRVRATRDGMPDRFLTAENAAELDGRDCGNGVFIDHADGWSTQYCHLKQGSISVSQGDIVTPDTVLGRVGLSGRTQFPHVHVTVRKDDKTVDPFAPDGRITCDAPSTETLWETDLPYRPGGMINVGFSDGVPDYEQIKDGTAAAAALPATAPAIVVFGYAFGGRAGDQIRLRIDGPDGDFLDSTVTLDRDQAQFFRASGKRLRTEAWAKGTYDGSVSLIRNGEIIDTASAELSVE